MVESLFEGEPPEPDLIGDEWQAGSPDQPVPEPSELEWDLSEGPRALLGGHGVVEPAPIVPTAAEIAEAQAREAGGTRSQGEPQVEWAWGADYSPEKADLARRERQQAALEAG